VIADVQAYLDTWAPIGADVTVAAPTVVAVDVRATVTIGGGFAGATWRRTRAWPSPPTWTAWGWARTCCIAAEGDAIWRTSGRGRRERK
jgi:hypothetical protein